MDKNQLEKENIYKWGSEHTCKEMVETYFTKIDKSMQTYFIPRESTDFLTSYEFETLPELEILLDELWKEEKFMKDIEKICLIAAMKNKPTHTEKNKSGNINPKEQLPQYIYNF